MHRNTCLWHRLAKPEVILSVWICYKERMSKRRHVTSWDKKKTMRIFTPLSGLNQKSGNILHFREKKGQQIDHISYANYNFRRLIFSGITTALAAHRTQESAKLLLSLCQYQLLFFDNVECVYCSAERGRD